jgi:hypothetical protein
MGVVFRIPSMSYGVSDLKPSKFRVITLLLFGMVIALTGIVCADQPVPALPETQTLSTATTADVVGLTMEADAGTWTSTNNGAGPLDELTAPGSAQAMAVGTLGQNSPNTQQLIAGGGSITYITWGGNPNFIYQIVIPESMLDTDLADPSAWGKWKYIKQNFLSGGYKLTILPGGIHDGILNPGQVQYTTAYDASIVAQAGHTAFIKSMNLDTRNKVIGQSNLNAQTGLTFIATADGGNIVGSENLMIDGAGNTTSASDRMLCPFSAYPADVIPAYCNIVQAGSRYDLTVGSVTTNANDRFVSSDATNPVALNYAINVKTYGTPQGQIPAMGSTMAYMKAHIQEARGYDNVTVLWGGAFSPFTVASTPKKAEDIVYNEQSSAQGTITAFNKVMAYQSGKSLL